MRLHGCIAIGAAALDIWHPEALGDHLLVKLCSVWDMWVAATISGCHVVNVVPIP